MNANEKLIHTAKDMGQAIRQRRKKLKITQKSLALQTGVSVPTVIAIERGNEKTGIGIVLALCEGLGLDLTAKE
jgi:transcriptional regulator with XRE-family HTH domain